MFRRIGAFIKKVAKAMWRTIASFVKDTVNNAEATILLCTSAVGVSAIIGKQAMVYQLPAFINAPMVIPMISIAFVVLLTYSMQWRMSLCSA